VLERLSRLLLVLPVLAILWLLPRSLCGQGPVIDREAKIKAAYIVKLVTYVEWPSSAFAAPGSPIVLGVAGESDVTQYVELITRERMVGDRRLVFKYVADVNDARSCHVLFVSARIAPTLLEILVEDLSKAPVLFVGEDSAFDAMRQVITFVVQDNRVRLQLSMLAASQRKLKISSQLAKLAEVVD
jgi:hypothetical protein